MKKLRNILLASLVVVLFSSGLMAQSDIITAPEFMKLYKTDKSLVIIDASKADSYYDNHIKGSVNIPHLSLYKDDEIAGLVEEPEVLANIFGSNGVSETNTIVVYDGGSQKYSSRLYWILKYLGAPNVKILHRDMAVWGKSRVPVTISPTKVSTVTFTPSVDLAVIADMAYVKSGKAVIIDARTIEEYEGTSERSVGHIPGAININYKKVLNDKEAFKSKSEMEALVAEYDLSPNQSIVVYCNTAVIASVIYTSFTKVLGWSNVKIYDGAYKEWDATGNVFDR